MRLEIPLERCLCIHSLSQVVDITIQLLLYQRQFIPEPANFILQSDSERSQIFKDVYEKITNALREIFCSMNRAIVREFIIIVGPFTYLPKEIYRIPIFLCKEHTVDGIGCGENCSELSNREKRMIFKSIVIDQLDGLSPPSRTDKVFFFVNTSDPLPIEVASIEEDSCFEIPSQDVQAKQRIRQLFIDVSFVCNGKTLNDSSGEKKICFWSRILPYIVNFHDL